MSHDPQYVVCFGQDEPLLATRRSVLEHAGYAVLTASTEPVAERLLLTESVRLLILCHSLTAANAEKILKFHQESKSPAPVLCLSAGDFIPANACTNIHDSRKGPIAFIAAVQKLSKPTAS